MVQSRKEEEGVIARDQLVDAMREVVISIRRSPSLLTCQVKLSCVPLMNKNNHQSGGGQNNEKVTTEDSDDLCIAREI